MTKTKLVAITMLLAVLMPLLFSFTASAQPSAAFYFYTPEGLSPGSKILVHVELEQKLDKRLSLVFARIVSIPIYIETADDAQIVELLLLNETKNSLSLYVDALRQYVYKGIIIQSTDTYGFVIKPAIRGHGIYSENITFTIPQTARCGDTLFLYFHVTVDGHDYDILRPIGVVCDAFRLGAYTEKQIADLLNKYQAALKENTKLIDQTTDLMRMLSKCSSEKTYLNNTLQEKEKEISTLSSQVGELQRQLKQQMSQNETLTILLAFTFVTMILITVYLAKRLKGMKKSLQ
jgi:regulator of replication initiation timing